EGGSRHRLLLRQLPAPRYVLRCGERCPGFARRLEGELQQWVTTASQHTAALLGIARGLSTGPSHRLCALLSHWFSYHHTTAGRRVKRVLRLMVAAVWARPGTRVRRRCDKERSIGPPKDESSTIFDVQRE